MLLENNIAPLQTVRVNTTKATVEQVLTTLEREGVKARRSKFMPQCLHLESGQAARTGAFRNGLITIQDGTSCYQASFMVMKG